MNNLSKYILEKLHLNKDIKISKVSYDLKKGDFFLIISLNHWAGDYEVEIYYPFEVISKSNGKLKYKTNGDKIVNNDFIINSNNYIEFKFKTQSAVIVNVSTAISILEKIVSEDYIISKDILYDYFDIDDVKLLDKYKETIAFRRMHVDSILTAFKKVDSITEKLHLDKSININSNKIFDSYKKWIDYLEDNGAKIIKYNDDGNIYGIYLAKSNLIVDQRKNPFNGKYSIPILDIEINKYNMYWEFYLYEGWKVMVEDDNKTDHQRYFEFKFNFLDEEKYDKYTAIECNITKKEFHEHKKPGFLFSSNNADFILNILNETYDSIKRWNAI